MLGNNDWNILEHYNPFIVKFLQSVGFNVKCMVNWNENVHYYLFVDGIYPCQLIFVQMIHQPHPRKNKLILLPCISIVGKMLNVCLKCYSFIFIIVNPCEQCDHKIILHILMVNVLLHTMILKDKCNEKLEL